MSDDILEKAIVSTEIGNPAGAGLKRVQADRFIDYIIDDSVLLKQVRVHRMLGDVDEVQKMGVGENLIRAAVEAVDTGENQNVVFSRISLTTKKIRLDYEISTETLEDNIEGNAFQDHVARLFATQFSRDLENLAINGDVSSSNGTLRIFDGWRKVLLNGSNGANGSPLTEGAAHVVDAGGAELGLSVFNRALRAMPRRWMVDRGQFRFYTGGGLIGDYLYSLATTDNGITNGYGANLVFNGPNQADGAYGFQGPRAFGVPVQEVPKFREDVDGTYSGAGNKDHGDLWLLNPQNLIWAIKREVVTYNEFKPKKDTREFTVFIRCGIGVESTDQVVIVTNVAAKA